MGLGERAKITIEGLRFRFNMSMILIQQVGKLCFKTFCIICCKEN